MKGPTARAGVTAAALAAALGLACAARGAEPAIAVHVELSGEPASEYRTDEPVAEADRAIAGALRARYPHLEFSSNLACAARELGVSWRSTSLAGAPHELLTFLVHACGCPDASAFAQVVATTSEASESVWEQLDATLAAAREPFSHVGMARVADPTGDYRWRWVTLLAVRRLSLEPLPRRVATGEALAVRFALTPGLDDPEVIAMAPSGATRRVVARRVGRRWEASLALATAGEHTIEVVADDALGPQVLAVFPVSVGVPPPRRWHGEPPPAESIEAVADAERYLRRLVDRERAAAGQAPLVWSESLAAVARAHAEDMRDHAFMGHVSPSRGDLAERLARAGLKFAYAAENVARSGSLWEAMKSLMRSPGHRRNILSPQATHAGVGVSFQSERGGERTYLVTQVFVRPRLASDPARY